MARKSALRPSVLEIATNLALVGYKESINATLKPLEL